MSNKTTFSEKILQFNSELSKINIDLPEGFHLINPFNGENSKKINEITKKFYSKFYNDNNPRRIIIGSSPARRGTALTGIPYEDAEHLQKTTGIYPHRQCLASGLFHHPHEGRHPTCFTAIGGRGYSLQ